MALQLLIQLPQTNYSVLIMPEATLLQASDLAVNPGSFHALFLCNSCGQAFCLFPTSRTSNLFIYFSNKSRYVYMIPQEFGTQEHVPEGKQ